MTKPNPWWRRFWWAWLLFGIIFEKVSLRYGTPLTGVVRADILPRTGLLVLLGAVLFWLPYHFLFDPGPGVGAFDIGLAITGAVAALLGVLERRRVTERRKRDEESKTDR